MKPRPAMVAVPDLGPLVALQPLTASTPCLSPLPPLPADMKNLPRLASRTHIKVSKLDLIQSLFFILSLIPLTTTMNLIPTTVPQITFSSINCNSLNMSEQTSLHHLIKLYGVVKLKTDVIFMSDIRLKNARGVANITKIENTFRTNPYCAYRFFHQSNSNKRGVGILIKHNLSVNILQEERDAGDNFLLLRISTGGKELIIGSIYGPNHHNPAYFDNLKASLNRLGSDTIPIVIGGDWNCSYSILPIPNNPDVLNMRSLPNKRHTELLLNLCTDCDLIDPYRAKFPNQKIFSYTPTDPLKRNRSRLDFFLVSTGILHSVSDTGILPFKQNSMFDHSAATLSFIPTINNGIKRPTISNLILKDPDLDLVVGLAVADTYLSCTAINEGIDIAGLKRGVGTSIKTLRELGVSDVFLTPGERTEAVSLSRAARIAEIKDFLDTFPFDRLGTGAFARLAADPEPVPDPVPDPDPIGAGNLLVNCDDLFMEGLMNNVRNSVVSHQNFVFKSVKKNRVDLEKKLKNL
jgi:exonuclease III